MLCFLQMWMNVGADRASTVPLAATRPMATAARLVRWQPRDSTVNEVRIRTPYSLQLLARGPYWRRAATRDGHAEEAVVWRQSFSFVLEPPTHGDISVIFARIWKKNIFTVNSAKFSSSDRMDETNFWIRKFWGFGVPHLRLLACGWLRLQKAPLSLHTLSIGKRCIQRCIHLI